MLAIFKKELNSFFATPLGYVIIGLFLLLNGLLLWVFKNQYNIFNYGFADLSKFFLLSQWLLLFIIPAITMRSFSEEQKTGTLELLLIKPISVSQIIFGKLLGALMVIVIALLPTLLYVSAIGSLGLAIDNFDKGIVIGGYFGLLLLALLYTSIGTFSSSITSNQIFALLIAVLLCFVLFFGFDALANLLQNGFFKRILNLLSIQTHFTSIARGVLRLGDIIYFLASTGFFVFITSLNLNRYGK